MKKQKQKIESYIDLNAMAGGAFAEKFNEALMQVAENIQNPNTEATVKRGITVNIKFAPNKTRNMVSTTISVTTKLAATEAIDTEMIMGVNLKTGQIELAEYDGQIRGQMSLTNMEQAEEPEPVETEAAEPEQVQPSNKPLDLRNRGKKQEPKMVPGRDFDPVTGEVYETDEQEATTGRVIHIGKVAQA